MKFKRNNVKNHLESYDQNNEEEVQGEGEEDDGEGEYDGEGEGSSSCSWSSCLREKNADNALSLKLSQYSYVPTNGPQRARIESENESYYEGAYEVDNESYNLGDHSQSNAPVNHFYPDNLNNGKYKMNMMSQ